MRGLILHIDTMGLNPGYVLKSKVINLKAWVQKALH